MAAVGLMPRATVWDQMGRFSVGQEGRLRMGLFRIRFRVWHSCWTGKPVQIRRLRQQYWTERFTIIYLGDMVLFTETTMSCTCSKACPECAASRNGRMFLPCWQNR